MKIARPHHLPSLSILASCLLLTTPGVHADTPMRGNPVDSLPFIGRPQQPAAAPAPTVAPVPTPEQQSVQSRLAQRIVPRHFDVSGVHALPFAEVSGVLTPLAGKETTVGELVEQVNKITELYRSRGYPLSFALLQNQNFDKGVVVVTVVEGFISSVKITGDIGAAQDRLQSIAQPLYTEKPLTQATLERVLNLMRTVPGVQITPKLDLPRRADGATELEISATRKAVQASGGLADLGTGLQPLASIGTNSLTPMGEQVKLTAAIPTGSGDARYYAGEARLPIGHDGLSAKLDGYHYQARPQDAAIQSLGLRRTVTNDRIGLGLSYPLLLNNRRSLTATAGMYGVNGQDRYDLEGSNRWLRQDTRVRALTAELRYIDVLPERTTDVSLSVSHGMKGLGANKDIISNYGASGIPDVDLGFTRYNLTARQSFALPAQFGVVFGLMGQYSPNKLPASEQTSFGRWRYAMGYPQGDQSGDKGIGLSAELNRRFLTGWQYVSTLQPYAMVDFARTWYNSPSLQAVNERHLSSVSLGLRLTDDKYYLFDFNIARPVGDLPANSNRRRLQFNANYTLFYDAL
jgi:hemolysin activation/secretion protein